MVDAHQIWERLRRKFFPTKNKSPPPFIDEIFHLVANTCIPTCKMDDVFNLLKEADHSADYAIIEPIISKADAWTDVAPIEPSNSLAEFKSLVRPVICLQFVSDADPSQVPTARTVHSALGQHL